MQRIDLCLNWTQSAFGQRIISLMNELVLDRAQSFVNSDEDDIGRLEVDLGRAAHQLLRDTLERAVQAKADGCGPQCPDCGGKLTKGRRTFKTFQTMSGPIRIKRFRG